MNELTSEMIQDVVTYLKHFQSLNSGYECPRLIHVSAETLFKNYCLSPLHGCVSQPSHPY